MTVQVYRGRFNQPSTLQPHHNLDGRVVIVEDRDPKSKTIRVHFFDGSVHNMEVFRNTVDYIGVGKK